VLAVDALRVRIAHLVAWQDAKAHEFKQALIRWLCLKRAFCFVLVFRSSIVLTLYVTVTFKL
jgi:hypothetical protein